MGYAPRRRVHTSDSCAPAPRAAQQAAEIGARLHVAEQQALTDRRRHADLHSRLHEADEQKAAEGSAHIGAPRPLFSAKNA